MKKHLLQRIPKIHSRYLPAALMIACLLLTITIPAFAQISNVVQLNQPDFSTYPQPSLYFRVVDGSGRFIKNLDTTSVHVIENEQVISPDTLELLEPGVRVVVAVNEGPTLANRYAQVARIDKIKTSLIEWAQSKSITTMDDFSLVINSGIVTSNLTKPSDWIEVLNNYQPDMKKSKPGLSSLSSAIDLATAPSESHDKTSAVLYITSLPTEDENAGLEDLLSRAKLAGVHLFIWLVGPQTYAAEDQAAILIRAADETDGQFLVFSGPEELPDLSTYFDSLTYLYHAVFQSKIKTSGDYNISLRVNSDQTVLESDPVSFTLNVQPPNPFFVSPPARVERSWSETERIRDSVLTPDTTPLQIMVEFPDGMERDLVYSRLFIDNQLVDENTSAPFDSFEWDISSITTSGSYVMSASVQDSAGFIAQTVELPVEVVVQPKPQTWIGKLFSAFNVQTVALFVVIAAAGVLLVMFAIRTLRMNRALVQGKTHRLNDPLTQPVMIENDLIHPKPAKESRDQWPHLPGVGLAPARLVLQPGAGTGFPVEIPVGDQAITFGSDAKKARVVLHSPVVSPLHARITRGEEEHFKVFDEGSGSGTWLNYTPVSQYGAKLEHGDLIQFGAVAYRFEIYGSQPQKIRVEPLQEE